MKEKSQLKSNDVDVINFILHNNSATIEELCNCFEISQVNVRTILTRIEEFVAKNKLGKLEKDDNYHYYFVENSINIDFDYTPFIVKSTEKKERLVYIILKLILEKSINLTTISKELEISRMTLNSDLEDIRKTTEAFDLNLISIQWRGVFLKGNDYNLQKFSIFFIAKFYIENYFDSPFKRILNPDLYNYIRKYISLDTENKFRDIVNKLYHYFNIKLGIYHYNILLATLVFIHLGKQVGIEFAQEFKVSTTSANLEEVFNDLLEKEHKDLLGDDYNVLFLALSNAINKTYTLPVIANVDNIVSNIYSEFNLDEKKDSKENREIFSFLLQDMYLENSLFIPAYIKVNRDEEKFLNDELVIKLSSLFGRYKLPYGKKNLSFLGNYLKGLVSESHKKNLLLIDNSSMTWKGNKLKDKIKGLEQINSITVVSYFNFKFFTPENYSKYQVFIFIDLPMEKHVNYPKKICRFINGYDLLKTNIDFSQILD